MKNLRGAISFVRHEQSSAKAQLISDLNKPIYCLRYGSFNDYVDFIIRNSNKDRRNAELFVKTHAKKYNQKP